MNIFPAKIMYTVIVSLLLSSSLFNVNASVNSTCAQPPRATAGHLPAWSVPGVGHLQMLHCPGAGHLPIPGPIPSF